MSEFNAASMTGHLLLVDTDANSCRRTASLLQSWGLRVTTAAHFGVLERLPDERFDLVVLAPAGVGHSAWPRLRALRQRTRLPVLALLIGDEVLDRVLALESGVDAVMSQPSDPRELRARVRSLLGLPTDDAVLHFGRFRLNPAARRLEGPNGFSTPLTMLEYSVLRGFLERPQSVLRREDLMDLAQEGPREHGLDLVISRLRSKLEETESMPALHGVATLFDEVPMFRGPGPIDPEL